MDCPAGGDLAAEMQPPCAGAEQASAEYWRREVAARLERYRSRRKPRVPRYPSLRLPFDSAENWSSPASAAAPPVIAPPPGPTRQNVAFQLAEPSRLEETPPTELRVSIVEEQGSSNLIEFPRSAAIPVFQAGELAEAVLDRPRIVEAPEVIPPPPALGGILIETISNRDTEKRLGTEFPRRPASLPRRMLAGLVDALILIAALGAFTGIFLRVNGGHIPIPLAIMGVLTITVMLWAGYDFLFLVYTGSTPGLRAAHLRLAVFDGSPVRRRLRRYRVLASFLSACSLGLGYLWSMLDEDGLCWHDRITRTYVEPSIPPKVS